MKKKKKLYNEPYIKHGTWGMELTKMTDDIKLAEMAYEAYRNHTGGISLISKQPIPIWEELREDIQNAWVASAIAIRKELHAKN
jgi:hypothetical protein